VSVAMKKVPAVAQVRVSLNDGLTILDLKPANAMTIAQIRQIIKNSGFVSKEAAVVAAGAIDADRKLFVVGGTREELPYAAAPERVGEQWRFTVPAPK
jgi:hypothetical protein